MIPVVTGIDVGGTNTTVGLVGRAGRLVAEAEVTTTRYPDVHDFVAAVAGEVNRLLTAHPDLKLTGVGIGAPNGNYYHGTIEHAPNLAWQGVVPLVKMLRARLGVPAVLTNDANAAALGELLFGAAQGLRDFIVITLGTGVGSGIVTGGNVLYGHDGFAGEIGHTIYDPEGRECGCGRRGCLETYASAGGIKRTVFELLAHMRAPSVLRQVSFEDLTAEHITEAAAAGDAVALRAFEVTGRILGLKLADAVAHTSPAAIFLFGGLARAGKYIFEPTQRYMEDHMLNIFKHKVKLLPSGLPEGNVAVLGAAALIWKELEQAVELSA